MNIETKEIVLGMQIFILLTFIISIIKNKIIKNRNGEDNVSDRVYNKYITEEIEISGKKKGVNIFGILLIPVLLLNLLLDLSFYMEMRPDIYFEFLSRFINVANQYEFLKCYYLIVTILFFIVEYKKERKFSYLILMMLQVDLLYTILNPSTILRIPYIYLFTGILYIFTSNSIFLKITTFIYAISGFLYSGIMFYFLNNDSLLDHKNYFIIYILFVSIVEILYFLLKTFGIDRKKISY